MSTRERNHTVDCLKGIAILFIVITHFDNIPNREINSLRFLFPFWLSMAVPIFMVLSGYINAKSYARRGVDTIKAAYVPRDILRRLLRFLIPFLPVFIIEQVATRGGGTTLVSILGQLLKGGAGKGSYYIPILIQFVLVFPAVFFLVRKYQVKGVWIFGVCNFLFDLVQHLIGLDESIYRLLVFRYLFVIALGCYAGLIKEIHNRTCLVGMSFIGFVYIVIIKYFHVNPPLTGSWSGTSMWASMFIAPVIIILLQKGTIKSSLFEILGKASYDIFLVQMLYYYLVADYVYALIGSTIIQLISSIIICLIAGVLFYKVETPFTKKIVSAL